MSVKHSKLPEYVEKNVYSVSYYICGEDDESEFHIIGTFNTKNHAKEYLLTRANNFMKDLNDDYDFIIQDSDVKENNKEYPYRVSKGKTLSDGEYMVIHSDDIPADGLPDSRYGTKKHNMYIFRIHKSRLHKNPST